VLIFRDVARAGSISAAARELGWTQPAVSQHLRALERSAGCALLVRTSSGVELTEPGRVLLARADELAAQLHMATEELAELTALRRGLVRLAAYPSAAATLVPDALARLRLEHPAIDVELTEAEWERMTGLDAALATALRTRQDRVFTDADVLALSSFDADFAGTLRGRSLGALPIV
jgi:DNA-binding transcriptional LysR family regulator